MKTISPRADALVSTRHFTFVRRTLLAICLVTPLPAATVFTDANLTTPGLTGSYVNRSLEGFPAAVDWRASQEICGTRVDTNFARATGDWGLRGEVGVDGGSDEDWENFSVQWDGYLQVTQAGQRFATASDDGSRMWIDVNHDDVFSEDELLNNGWGGGQSVTVGGRSPALPNGIYRIRIQYYEISGENEFHLVSSSWLPRQFMPAAGNPRQTVRVLVLNFEPRIPLEANRRLWEVFGWNNPRMLARQFKADLEFMTGGAISVQIVDWRDLDEFPLFSDGFRYSPDQYVANRRTNTGWHNGSADFYHLARRQNLAELVNSDQVDEIWCFGDHYFSLFGEAWMAGPNPFFINGPSFPDAGFDRAIAGYGFNYERGVAEMIHNLSHRTENHGQRAFGSWDLADPATAFDHFSANFLESPGKTAGVGTCHVPANADGHYDYENERVVQSTAFDWADYPNHTGATTAVGRDTWAFGPGADCHRDYMNFYFAMMPRNDGTAPDGRQANWFKYIWDFNTYEEGTGLPRGEDAFGSGATVLSAGGTDHEFTVRYYDQTGINPATLGDGDVEVRGPGGFEQIATLVGVQAELATTAGTARTVTYRITAPGGAWDLLDAGGYRIFMRENEVGDTLGNFVPSGDIGSFMVMIADPAAIPIGQMLNNAQATVTHTTLDIGEIASLFDGSVDTLIRTADINPAIVTLTFTQPQTIHAMRAYFTYASGDPAVRWEVETADTLEDLDGKTGTWRQAVPPTGTTTDRFSTVTFGAPITASLVRLTATKLGGDDYVHANEWQLIGAPVSDTTPPVASASSADVADPGGASQFIVATYADDTAVKVASLHTDNVIVTGPGDFSTAAVFYDADSHFDGSPRLATYWFLPPGGSWDSSDNGAYTITLQPGQVRDTVENVATEEQTLGTFHVNIAPPVRRPAHDLAEMNAADWRSGADGASASTADDASRKTLGAGSIRFETDGGSDTWLRFPSEHSADWDLTNATNLYFSVYAENDETFQENSPWIRLDCNNGGYFEYRYYEGGNQADPLNDAIGSWKSLVVPLSAPDNVTDGWRCTTVGSPSLEHIVAVEFHADTWGEGFTLWYDRVGFDLPVRVIESGLDVFAGASRLRLRFDAAVAATLALEDLLITDQTTGLPVPTAVMSLVYQADSNTAVVTFPGLAGGRLANGTHHLVLAAGAVADPAGNVLVADFVADFRVLNGDSDADNDGMSDTWERSQGFDPAEPGDASEDEDADLQTNLHEYQSGTDPLDPVSRFVITAVSRSASVINVTWRSVPGRQYRIDWSNDLSIWNTLTQSGQPVMVDASANGDFTQYEIPIPGDPPSAQCFFRIAAVNP